jgi:hypothetical protein
MADEETLAATPGAETGVETPVNDGIIDLDALPEVKEDNDEELSDEAKAAAAKAAEETVDPEKKKPSGAQRAKAREQRLLNELSARDRELEELRRNQPADKTASDSDVKPPREEDFNGDYFAFQRALTAHEAGKAASDAIEKQFKTREQSEHQAKQAQFVRERDEAHMERVEDAREVIADFDKTMEGMKGVNVRNEVIDEIKASENSALLAYHLAKNPDKLNALNSMSGRELAREMGRLEATVKLPVAKQATSAPAPLSTPRGGAAPSSADSDLAKWMAKTYPKRA